MPGLLSTRQAKQKPLLHDAGEVFHIKELCGRNRYDILVPA